MLSRWAEQPEVQGTGATFSIAASTAAEPFAGYIDVFSTSNTSVLADNLFE